MDVETPRDFHLRKKPFSGFCRGTGRGLLILSATGQNVLIFWQVGWQLVAKGERPREGLGFGTE